MNERNLKYLFRLSALLLLIIMLFASRDAGISCDEMLHYGQSEKVYNYFVTGGKDKSALEDTELNLKYYGQSYDNLVTFVTKWSGIEDIYAFRRLMSAVMGWLAIVVTALFARWLRNYLAAIIVILMFAISPFFIGHSYNNLKDIPFAFAYISGIWFMFRFLEKSGKISIPDALFLTLSFAFCISIRAGGLILICYLFFFFIVFYVHKYFQKGTVNSREIIRKAAWILVISLVAFLMSSLLWPYALQDPLRNIIESYKVMAHYPATFRQLFEGTVEWSDYMPWYYLFKSMAITIPVVILLALVLFTVFAAKVLHDKRRLFFLLLAFTVLFPVVFVIFEQSNLYSSWRQFLFVYPGIVILASTGLVLLFESVRKKYIKIAVIALLLILSVHPVRYMIKNHPYEYIYYNELAGGVNGAYGNYELDYYYTGQAEASEWLINYLEENNIKDGVRVLATYPVDWFFRDHPGIATSWFRFEERSMHDWDYAIVTTRYIPPFQLKNKIWPPENAIKVIYADEAPICAVLERRTKDDFLGYRALKDGNYADAVDFLNRAVTVSDKDEMIFYNFAGALYKLGEYSEADSVLKKGLQLNPDSELILMYLGNIARENGMKETAMEYYQKVIDINRKYFDAWVSLSELMAEKDVLKARGLLRQCLMINPGYKPAIIALGDTYRQTNPEIARKYYEQAGTIN